MTLVAGVDFGTLSVRVSIFDEERGRLGFGVAEYPLLRDRADPDRAAQRHADQMSALEKAFALALLQAEVDGGEIAALAIDATGSSVVPLDDQLQPLDDYYLWCDHRARREAEEITAAARAQELTAIAYCGGTYSPEWGFAKVLHWLRHHPGERERFATAAEHCDVAVATLCGISDPRLMTRSICAMGHKWMWNAELGGLPPEAFLASVDPLLAGVRDKIDGRYQTSDIVAGTLSETWARRLGLRAGIPLPTGALDAHWDAIGVGCRLGDVVNVIGTSTCIMALSNEPRLIPGVAGIVAGSIHPGYFGIEAGMAAVGDLFDAIARRAGCDLAELAEAIQDYRPGQTGLLRLPWDNGDRSVLADATRSGITFGWRLHHSAADELFAAIEGTGFQTRIILDRMAEHGVPVTRVINAGGVPQRNATLNRVYAAILGKPILVPEADTTSLGAAIFAFLAAGTFASVEEAQAALCPSYRVYEPEADAQLAYQSWFELFERAYFSEELASIVTALQPH